MTSGQEYLAFGTVLAQQAAEKIEAARGSRHKIHRKPDGTLVTQFEIDLSKWVIDEIRKQYPKHAVHGEELSVGGKRAADMWRFVPISGTGEYLHGSARGLATYGFGMAKEHGGKLEAALFICPQRSETYTAIKGLGAYLNGRRIRVNSATFGPRMKYDYSYWDGVQPDVRFYDDMLGKPLGRYSAIYQACEVASGGSAFAVFPGSSLHVIRPGTLIAQEAGAKVTDVRGLMHAPYGTPLGAVYSNGKIHDIVRRSLHGYLEANRR